ncbi:hypothetical protein OPKNFCMD_2449 [Methylobacterium crusticola]|uniref:Resolvase/invertase-type recombinase catalytic domain-containing protein n=2 Tax=Methylobacterium crusticola TaxID=1697972 RepID=A0ABQ4QYK0_9HYPH|nr:hypothetical protein OPKNFCMD_2449 [Methylobacterium crusticola]
MLIGYARVSTTDQNLDLQRVAPTGAGCSRIFEGFAVQVHGAMAEYFLDLTASAPWKA